MVNLFSGRTFGYLLIDFLSVFLPYFRLICLIDSQIKHAVFCMWMRLDITYHFVDNPVIDLDTGGPFYKHGLL